MSNLRGRLAKLERSPATAAAAAPDHFWGWLTAAYAKQQTFDPATDAACWDFYKSLLGVDYVPPREQKTDATEARIQQLLADLQAGPRVYAEPPPLPPLPNGLVELPGGGNP
jgi:hypothetical protein